VTVICQWIIATMQHILTVTVKGLRSAVGGSVDNVLWTDNEGHSNSSNECEQGKRNRL
jgi:hypothetical protein